MLAHGETKQYRPSHCLAGCGGPPWSPYFQEGQRGISGTFDMAKLQKNGRRGNPHPKDYLPECIADSKALFHLEGIRVAGRAIRTAAVSRSGAQACPAVSGDAHQGRQALLQQSLLALGIPQSP